MQKWGREIDREREREKQTARNSDGLRKAKNHSEGLGDNPAGNREEGNQKIEDAKMQREKANKKRSSVGRCSNNREKDMQVPESRNIRK